MIKQQLYNLIRVMVFSCTILFNSLFAAQVEKDSIVVTSTTENSQAIEKGKLHIVGNVVLSGVEHIENTIITKSEPQNLVLSASNTIKHKSSAKQLDAPKPTFKIKVNKLGMERIKIHSGNSDGKWQISNLSISKSSVLSVVQFKFLATFIFCFIFSFIFLLTKNLKISGRFFNIISMFLQVGFGRPPPISL